MSVTYPISGLLLGPKRCVAVYGPHFRVFDSSSGEALFSSIHVDHNERPSFSKCGPIRHIALDPTNRYLTTLAEDKKMRIWDITDTLKLLNERELPKKPTCVCFTRDGSTLVVSDKFGDVFSYPTDLSSVSVTPDAQDAVVNAGRSSIASHENRSGGTLVLGHTSLLTTFILTPDEHYIITADRDEHIRVSWYPQGHVIEAYCLGSTQFVSALHIPKHRPEILLSGGGDADIKIWDWQNGLLKYTIPIPNGSKVYQYVQAVDGNGAQTEEIEEGTPVDGAPERGSEEPKGTEPKFAVNKMMSLPGDIIVFTAVGNGALFAFPLSDSNVVPEISVVDLGRPILDIGYHNGSNLLWVSLDGTFNIKADQVLHDNTETNLRVIRVTSNKLELVPADNLDIGMSTLWKHLTAPFLPDDAEDISSLDLYYSFRSFPKDSYLDQSALEGEAWKETKRLQGRLKKKEAVQKVQQRGLQNPPVRENTEEATPETFTQQNKRPRPE